MITNLELAKQIISDPSHRITFILGNGINRYAFKKPIDPSWNKLLLDAWKGASFETRSVIDEGITYTEFYDLMCLESNAKDVTDSIINAIKSWGTTPYHNKLQERLIQLNRPVLTTNFDMCLEGDSLKKVILEHPRFIKGFTDFYPWNVVSTNNSNYTLHNIYDFGIWHINGSIDYRRSLKLSLSSYTRQAKRAVEYMHTENYDDDFDRENNSHWKGMNTWLHLIFNSDLFIIGLGLDEQETFLRWLLIERIKYLRRNPDIKQKRKGWYVVKAKEMNEGKKFFLRKVGFETIELKSYKQIYQTLLGIKGNY